MEKKNPFFRVRYSYVKVFPIYYCRTLPAPALALLVNLLPLGHTKTSSYASRLLAAFCISHQFCAGKGNNIY